VLYQLPFGRGNQFLNDNAFVDAVIGGWQLSDSLVLSSGNPFTVYGTQNTYGGYGNSFPKYNGSNPYPAHKNYNTWFNESAFTLPANGTPGKFRRNSLYKPGLEYTNLALQDVLLIRGNEAPGSRGCVYNAFNHSSFGEPGQSGQTLGFCTDPKNPACPASPQPGDTYSATDQQITTLQVGARNIQLGARLSF
jgi:hypothetical protein